MSEAWIAAIAAITAPAIAAVVTALCGLRSSRQQLLFDGRSAAYRDYIEAAVCYLANHNSANLEALYRTESAAFLYATSKTANAIQAYTIGLIDPDRASDRLAVLRAEAIVAMQSDLVFGKAPGRKRKIQVRIEPNSVTQS